MNKRLHPERILLPRFDTLGDLVLLEGFIRALRQRFPQARISLLVRRPYADLSALFPLDLDWLVTDVDPHKQPPDMSLCKNLLADLGGAGWDLLLITACNRTWADDFMAASLHPAERIALGDRVEMTENLRKVFAGLGLNAGSLYEHLVSVREDSHESEKYQALWQVLGGESRLPEPELRVSEHQRAVAGRIFGTTGLEPKKFCLCFPAGTQKVPVKVWPPDRFAEIIAWLERERNIRSLVAGHRSEEPCIQEVLRLADERGAKPVKWAGRDGEIPILAALAESAGFYLGNDTGPMHIAAAVNTPVIGIFGGGTWPRFIPRRDHSIAIAGEMPCFGCGWDCVFGDAPCMGLVTVQDVKQAVCDLLDGPGASGFRVLKGSNRLNSETERYVEGAAKTYREANKDRLARLEANLRLEKLLAESEADRSARLTEIGQLKKRLDESEADRAARLAEMERLEKQLAESEADRSARLVEVERLEKQLAESETDRAARLAEMERLGKQLAESETDRAARLVELERLGKQLAESDADRSARLAEIKRLEKIRNTALVRILIKLGLIRE